MALFPRLWNKRKNKDIPKDAVLVDRTTPWGNPWIMDDESERDLVCDNYDEFVMRFPEFKDAIKKELRGKDLICWCHPKRCHGETLLRIANE